MNEPTCGRCDHQLGFCTCISRLAYDAWQAKHDAERKAWARLVKAKEALSLFAMCKAVECAVDPKGARSPLCRDLTAEREAVSAAEQALRDLGVDVDALLTEEQ